MESSQLHDSYLDLTLKKLLYKNTHKCWPHKKNIHINFETYTIFAHILCDSFLTVMQKYFYGLFFWKFTSNVYVLSKIHLISESFSDENTFLTALPNWLHIFIFIDSTKRENTPYDKKNYAHKIYEYHHLYINVSNERTNKRHDDYTQLVRTHLKTICFILLCVNVSPAVHAHTSIAQMVFKCVRTKRLMYTQWTRLRVATRFLYTRCNV